MVLGEEAAGITAVIPNWNGRARTERLLGALGAQSRPPEQIIVVDNGSTDGSAEMARRCGATVIEMGRNAGFAAAVNRGVRAARTRWVALANNDVEPEAGWLELLAEAAERTGAWFATGKLLRGDEPDRIDGTFDLLCRGGCAWRAGHGRVDAPPWNAPRRIRIAPLTAALVRRELFERVGGLEERFEFGLEDVEWGLRCALGRYGGIYVPAAAARHAGSATLGVWHRDTVRWLSRNQALLIAKHYPARTLLQWAWPVLVAQLLWGVAALRRGRFRPWLRGKFEALRLWRAYRREAVWKGTPPRLLNRILRASEAEIYRLQRQEGFDPYWRLYFALTWWR